MYVSGGRQPTDEAQAGVEAGTSGATPSLDQKRSLPVFESMAGMYRCPTATFAKLAAKLRDPPAAREAEAVGEAGGKATDSIGEGEERQLQLPWEQLCSMPTERYGHDMVLWEGMLVCGGGKKGSAGVISVLGYRADKDEWQPLPDLPSARFMSKFHIIDGALCVGGGMAGAAAGGRVRMQEVVERLQPGAEQWEVHATVPGHYDITGTLGALTAQVDEKVFYFGVAECY